MCSHFKALSLCANKSLPPKNKSEAQVKQREAARAGRVLDITQVTCLPPTPPFSTLPPPPARFLASSLNLHRGKASVAEVSVYFTQRHSVLRLPQELSNVNNPNYTRTTRDSCFYYRAAPLRRQRGILPLLTAPRLGAETKGGGEEVQRKVDEVVYTRRHARSPSRDLAELFTRRSSRSAFVGRGPTKRRGSHLRQEQRVRQRLNTQDESGRAKWSQAKQQSWQSTRDGGRSA